MGHALNGDYVGISFEGENLAGYALSGNFVGCNFKGANLVGATLSGTFVSCNFTGAKTSQADMRDGVYRNVTWPKGK